MDMENNKINLIYIVGSGHSGSTLLDLIIGSAPEVFSLGEFAFFNAYNDDIAYNKQQSENYCTCKKHFHDCLFWNQIKNKEKFFIKKHFPLSESFSILQKTFLSLKHNNYPSTKIDNTFELLNKINEVHFSKAVSPTYYLDSSKDPRRLVYLLNDSRLNVYPIFLVKNGKSVAKSYSSPRRSYNLHNTFNLKRKGFVTSYILRWWLVNKTAYKLIKSHPNTFYISYEEFCESPQKLIQGLNIHLNIHISPQNFLNDVNNTIYHSIDGNALRFSPIKEIRQK